MNTPQSNQTNHTLKAKLGLSNSYDYIEPTKGITTHDDDDVIADRIISCFEDHKHECQLTISPGNERDIGREPRNIKQNQINTLRLSDYQFLAVKNDDLDQNQRIDIYWMNIETITRKETPDDEDTYSYRNFNINLYGIDDAYRLEPHIVIDALIQNEAAPVHRLSKPTSIYNGNSNLEHRVEQTLSQIKKFMRKFGGMQHEIRNVYNNSILASHSPRETFYDRCETIEMADGSVETLVMKTSFGWIDITDYDTFYDTTGHNGAEERRYTPYLSHTGTPLIVSTKFDSEPTVTLDEFNNCRVHTPVEFIEKLENLQFTLAENTTKATDTEKKKRIPLSKAATRTS